MLKWFAATLALVGSTAPVFALSCNFLDPAGMYQQAANSDDRYVIVHGSFLRDGPDTPLITESAEDGQGVPYTFPALFYGDIGSRVGFRTPTELEVTVDVSCVLDYCGAPPPDGREVLAFLRVNQDRDYFLSVEACPAWLIFDPEQEELDRIAACMRGDSCEGAD
ncbi:hypothetical protein [Nioella nitratireducens]|uniref:hypothetical protein n=1 Tax=Nioella nitratireducens TaxID=1287720 RepID=UPI0008FD89A5|nr:hypothetical protein [Nioella nitratireducens]